MPLIVYSKINPASLNIFKAILEKYPELEKSCVASEKDVIEVETDFGTDCIIVPSTHRSATNTPALTAHICGNWGNEAKVGGDPKTLNIAPAARLKSCLVAMKKECAKAGVQIDVTLEVDHHGPTSKVPIMFVEVGATEKEWHDMKLCAIAAAGIKAAFDATSINPAAGNPYIAFFGVGGGHYATAFGKLELDEKSDLAAAHLLPKYQIDAVDFEVFRQAVEKSTEPVGLVLIEKDGVNAKQRDKIIGFCDQLGIRWEKI